MVQHRAVQKGIGLTSSWKRPEVVADCAARLPRARWGVGDGGCTPIEKGEAPTSCVREGFGMTVRSNARSAQA